MPEGLRPASSDDVLSISLTVLLLLRMVLSPLLLLWQVLLAVTLQGASKSQ